MEDDQKPVDPNASSAYTRAQLFDTENCAPTTLLKDVSATLLYSYPLSKQLLLLFSSFLLRGELSAMIPCRPGVDDEIALFCPRDAISSSALLQKLGGGLRRNHRTSPVPDRYIARRVIGQM